MWNLQDCTRRTAQKQGASKKNRCYWSHFALAGKVDSYTLNLSHNCHSSICRYKDNKLHTRNNQDIFSWCSMEVQKICLYLFFLSSLSAIASLSCLELLISEKKIHLSCCSFLVSTELYKVHPVILTMCADNCNFCDVRSDTYTIGDI